MLAQNDNVLMELPAQVVRHKEAFYPSAWSRYDLTRPGSLRIGPAGERIATLRQEYRDMAVMIYGEPPGFEGILERWPNSNGGRTLSCEAEELSRQRRSARLAGAAEDPSAEG